MTPGGGDRSRWASVALTVGVLLVAGCSEPKGAGEPSLSDPPASASRSTSPEPTPNVSAHDWTTFGFDLERSGTNPDEVVLEAGLWVRLSDRPASLEQRGDDRGGAVFAPPPVVANGRLYQGSWDGRLYAFASE